MPITGPSINTHSQTLNELQKFATFSGQDAKIVGKRDPKNSDHIILYVKDKPSSVWSRISGKAAERRELGREGVQRMFDRAQKSMKGYNGGLFSSVHVRGETSALRAGQVRLTAKAVINEKSAFDAWNARKAPEPGPKLAQLGGGFNTAKFAGDLVDGLKKQLVKDLGDEIARTFKAGNPTKQELMNFGLSTGAGLRGELLDAFKAALSPDDKQVLKGSSADAQKVLEQAFNHAATKMLPDQVASGPLVKLQ